MTQREWIEDAANSLEALCERIRTQSASHHGRFAASIEQFAVRFRNALARGELSYAALAALHADGNAVVKSIGDKELALSLDEIVGRLNPLLPMDGSTREFQWPSG